MVSISSETKVEKAGDRSHKQSAKHNPHPTNLTFFRLPVVGNESMKHFSKFKRCKLTNELNLRLTSSLTNAVAMIFRLVRLTKVGRNSNNPGRVRGKITPITNFILVKR